MALTLTRSLPQSSDQPSNFNSLPTRVKHDSGSNRIGRFS